MDANTTAVPYTLAQLARYMLVLGTLGFGGPVALVGYMYRDLVERRRWISEADYKEGLALAQLMPGPLAAQLAIYLGYVHYGIAGATIVGVAFVVPSFVSSRRVFFEGPCWPRRRDCFGARMRASASSKLIAKT